jgi:phosphohistidine phosphatase
MLGAAMDLYLIRHAIAADAAKGQDDADRPLTDEGRERFARAVRGMREIGITFERVIHSPWKRAVQTAKLLEPVTYGPIESSTLLAKEPGGGLLEIVARSSSEGPLALVGHQPWLSQLGAWLLGGDRGRGAMLEIKKGGVVWLEGDPEPGKMRLKALWTPKTLRALAR